MSQTLKGLLVLICEDEALIRMSICDMLEEFGAVVTEAANAREALAHLEKGQFDIVVTDVGLPDLSGLELVKIIRKTHEKLPVIFATGAMEVAGSEALDHVYILRKPYSFEELCEAIAHIRTDG